MPDRLKVLLIDDDEEDFLIISDMLAEAGSPRYNVDWASTYEEGLAAIGREEHDVYLVDYLLGARNGLDLLEKAIAGGCKAPIIFFTAYGNYDTDLRAMKSGAADYLVKGEFGAPLLERVIRYSIERKNTEAELKRHRQHLEVLVRERTIQHAEARADAEGRAMVAEQRRAMLEALLEHLPEGITIVDSPGLKIQALSRYALEKEGLSRGDIEGRCLPEHQWTFFRPDGAEPGSIRELPIARAALDGQTISNEEWLLKDPRGGNIPILVSAGPIRDHYGHITGAVAAWRDVSDIKRIQSELQEARDDLEVRVYQRTLELADMMESLKESEAQSKTLAAQLLRAQEDERKRIAREMHDSIGSSLSAVKFCLENAAQQIKLGLAGPELLTQLSSVVEHSIEESRRIMTDLRPSILDDLGIIVTIGWFCRRHQLLYSGVCIEELVRIEESEIPEHLKIIIFRIIQEAMNNAAKYSGADRILLSLARTGDCIELCIEDNGTGFDPGAAVSRPDSSRGLGLTSMKERAELSGGTLEITSAPGAGTKIRACWELP
ncbi:MAG: ATP-binding protein [Syntrophobacteraceae bacterium]